MIRTRVTLCVLALLVVATAASVLILREVLLSRVDEHVDSNLAAGVEPLQDAAQRLEPAGERRRAAARNALDATLARGTPVPDGALVGFLGGRPYPRRRAAPPDGELAQTLAGLARVTEPRSGTLETLRGEARYLAVPIANRPPAALVAVGLTAGERERVEDDVRLVAIVSAAVLLLACLLALPATGFAVSPLRRGAQPGPRPGAPADDSGPVRDRPAETNGAGAVALVAAAGEQRETVAIEPGALDLDLFTHDLFAKAPRLGEREWHLDGTGIGLVVADQRRLTQAVMNAAESAVRRTDPGEPIWLGSSLVGGWARIWIRDRGRGVDPVDQRQIFERPAADGGEAPAGGGGGAGPGLAGVRAIAEAHGGRVELDCPPGLGATLTIILPAAAQEESALRRSNARMPSGAASVQSKKRGLTHSWPGPSPS